MLRLWGWDQSKGWLHALHTHLHTPHDVPGEHCCVPPVHPLHAWARVLSAVYPVYHPSATHIEVSYTEVGCSGGYSM